MPSIISFMFGCWDYYCFAYQCRLNTIARASDKRRRIAAAHVEKLPGRADSADITRAQISISTFRHGQLTFIRMTVRPLRSQYLNYQTFKRFMFGSPLSFFSAPLLLRCSPLAGSARDSRQRTSVLSACVPERFEWRSGRNRFVSLFRSRPCTNNRCLFSLVIISVQLAPLVTVCLVHFGFDTTSFA